MIWKPKSRRVTAWLSGLRLTQQGPFDPWSAGRKATARELSRLPQYLIDDVAPLRPLPDKAITNSDSFDKKHSFE
ncbi:hypothetical protein M8R20_20780 [Pseudomonas sp. R2.Fl]|nr:hypothetical protein [Pseudomonas sp. R2.Fl]